jgi:small subunit ribosomal protein S11
MENNGMKEISVILKGIGPGKIAASKQLEIAGFKITGVKDATPIPHNGTRPPKKILKRRKK